MKQNIAFCVFASILALSGCGIVASQSQDQHASTSSEGKALTKREDQQFSKFNLMPSGDYTKLSTIKQNIGQNKSISDSDLAWLVSLLHAPTSDKGVVYAKVLLTFCTIRNITEKQKSTILQATYPLLSVHEASDRYDFAQLYGIKVLETMKRKSSIPKLAPLLNHHNPQVVASAKQAIAVLTASGVAS